MIESFMHIVGICPDTNSHFDLINFYMCYIENNINLKFLFRYLEQKLYA